MSPKKRGNIFPKKRPGSKKESLGGGEGVGGKRKKNIEEHQRGENWERNVKGHRS